MSSRTAKARVAVASAVAVAAATAVAVTGGGNVASAATTTFTPAADTYVDNGSTGTNYGTSGQLGVDNSPVKRIFLRFTVSGLTAPVANAKLRVHTDDVSGSNSPAGGTFRAVSNNTWSETATTWSNQPAIDGATLGTLGSVSRNAWYEVDVTSAVTGNGTYSIAITSTNSDGADYDSRESGSATAPQLVISSDTTTTPPTTTTTTTGQSADPVLVGAGDIADSGSGDTATANLLDGISGTVFTTGDNVYPDGTASQFTTYYNPTWGRHKARTRPSPGNHDYNTSGATGYYGYFGAQAGTSGLGYYSYDLGNWHVVSLNSEISKSVGSPQEVWLRQDLAANTKPCTLAYWHKPRFTSGSNHAPDSSTGPLVQALYDNNAEVIVTGHNHQYERFAPMNPSGTADATRGIRHFVAGMGGAGFYGFGTIQPNSEARNSNTHGVLKFTLHANSYDWQFVPEAGKTYTDSGTNSCH
ncbi:DNRLRE domain-containing protein [Actinokineospora auranticolor]|uniref:Calcineurin-like phosphoesterase family protein n=1 Tax=Actinokineospora auranticolor TaxID=155976 RepID=A0A2S6GHL3_9PSEU|nr:DNRLRE domain-containing protein [Actinokineospora auranticolor]PPK64707.1 calcineurin-like phosphoesterase family protein [Actinokineospora auranticolor]